METLKEKYTNDIITLFNKGYSTREISDQLKEVSIKYVWEILNENHISVPKGLLSIEDDLKIKEMYESGLPAREILPFFPQVKSENTIIASVKRSGAKVRQSGLPCLTKNIRYFKDIDTELKAYFLGLIITDGSVYKKDNSLAFSITLKSEDDYLIKRLKEELGSKSKLVLNRGCTMLTIQSTDLCKDLISHNVVFNKSYHTEMPAVSNELLPHFLRGVFDGDGCFTNKSCVFYGTYSFIESIKQLLLKKLKVNDNKIIVREHGSCSISFSSYKDRKSIYNYLYQDANIYMKRKEEKFRLSM